MMLACHKETDDEAGACYMHSDRSLDMFHALYPYYSNSWLEDGFPTFFNDQIRSFINTQFCYLENNQLLQQGMLNSQFVLTYLSDFFWVVYHRDRDQIMCSQTPCNNFQALQMMSSVFYDQF